MKPLNAIRSVAVLATFLTAGVFAFAEPHEDNGEPGWFDCENCDVCQPMAERPDLMEDMKWEVHKLAGGMLMTSSVPADKKSDFYAICESMHAKAPAANAKLCGFCTGFGELLLAGAKTEEVKTASGMITIVTAEDKATIAKIHAVADRSTDEMAKMAAAE